MTRIYILFSFLLLSLNIATAQKIIPAKIWTDSVYKSLSPDERIAQLMIVRLSSINSKREVTFFDQQVDSLVRMYNIGGICLFQGGPVKQALLLNQLQAVAKTPLLISIDGEWGVGMRMTDSVLPLPRQMMLGAIQDEGLVYEYGKIVGEQCKRLNIQVNYAPVVDVNNNPNNPVINERSFGEDKYKVARLGILYMKGMQDVGVMACAKHFPGHGDVAVDSHYDLPLINKSMQQLDSLELYPFRQLINAGIGSVMVAHLSIPSIDSSANRPTSISKNNITGLLRNKIGFQGLTFTDALEMQGVKKYFPDGEASVQAIIAGNDMLCLPGDVPASIKKIKEAIASGKLGWADIEMHCKKVLMAKYQYGLTNLKPINTSNLPGDLNNKIHGMRRKVAENAITVLNKFSEDFFPMPAFENPEANNLAYICIGKSEDNAFARRMKKDYHADILYFNYKDDTANMAATIDLIKSNYKKVVIGIHAYNRTPTNNFGITNNAIDLVTKLQQQTNSISFVFGNPYAIKNWCGAKNLVACYEDDSIVQHAAIDLLQGKIPVKGKLPVTVCDEYKYGSGIISSASFFPYSTPEESVVSGLHAVSYTHLRAHET
jgi:beta-N-acetylhexosaminidase